MGTIREISEFHREFGVVEYGTAEGWRVRTDDETIIVAVGDQQDCCETAGYFSTDDEPQRFVGADLLRVERITDAMVPESVEPYGLDGGGAVFVNLVTNRGNLQLAVYNAHNGYYGHNAVVISRDLNISEIV